MKIKLGLQFNEQERILRKLVSDSDIQQVSDKLAMQPDLRQKAQDFINQGITLDLKTKIIRQSQKR